MFGRFKKIKDCFKKTKNFLANAMPKLKRFMNNAAPVVKSVLDESQKYITNDKTKNSLKKVNNYFDIANDGIDAFDDALNRKSYNKIKDWTKTNIKPRLKFNNDDDEF